MAAKLAVYEVNINGIRHTLQMNAEDAERIGATEVKPAAKAATAPANKAVTPPAK
jgi:hypothetical protein